MSTSRRLLFSLIFSLAALTWLVAGAESPAPAAPAQDEHIVLLGNGLGERMQYYGHFETELYQRYPDKNLVIRNMCNPGDTPAFRPRPGRPVQWAFPGAEKFRPEWSMHLGVGHYPAPDEWLTTCKADTILAFFGFNESFDGPKGLSKFEGELAAFIEHTKQQKYNGKTAPRIVIVSPIAFENLSKTRDLPDGQKENENLALYTQAMQRIAAEHGVGFVDVFSPTKAMFDSTDKPMTINGCHLTPDGYKKLAPVLADGAFGKAPHTAKADEPLLHDIVTEKQWMWHADYRMVNGVHVYGRRWKPYGNVNYPEEIEKIRQMTALRDQRIWDIATGKTQSLVIDDSSTRPLTPIPTNYSPQDQKAGALSYLDREEAIKSFTLPEGYKIEMFASEREFPDLRNPVQMTFDNKGRLWVAVMPTYPHWRPGDPRPNDKLLIFEDTDGDGRADIQKTFADKLHLPIGFEIAAEGVYLSQEPNLMLLKDTDGDDVADERHLIMHGFDSHDTHHAISAYTSDAKGAFYLLEGRFLHSQVETPYGAQRCNDGGAWRFDPSTFRLERISQYDYNNPWAITFDQWGQNFIGDASSGMNLWLLPISAKLPYGIESPGMNEFTTHRVRPTSGSEFLYSRHFPEDVQGDYLINNCIGFLGTKQHKVVDDGSGFTGELRHDLVRSTDGNFRPVDCEIAPDGSLYILDWHNALIGHMQHSARDPNRDHDHGRIYRVTYPSRPLVEPTKIAGESVEHLLEALKIHEYRTRYRARRELRGRPSSEVLPKVRQWVASLDTSDPMYERHLLEGMWVTWAQNTLDVDLLKQCLTAAKPEVRAAAVRVLRHERFDVPDAFDLFMAAAADEHPRVRLEAGVAASWVGGEDGAMIAFEVLKKPRDYWINIGMTASLETLQEIGHELAALEMLDVKENPTAQRIFAGELRLLGNPPPKVTPEWLTGKEVREQYEFGREVFNEGENCVICHKADGLGLGAFPPLANSEWIVGDEERAIKIVLKGLGGQIEVAGKMYNTPDAPSPPMAGFEHRLTDEQIAAVLTFARNSFGNKAAPVTVEKVKEVREQIKDRQDFYMVEEILKEHPMK